MATILIISVMLLLLYFYYGKRFSYWKNRNVPSISAFPVLGSYAQLLLQNDHQSLVMQKIYNRYQSEKFVGGFKGNNPELIVRDPEVIKSILVKDFNYFMDRGVIPETTSVVSAHLFNLGGDRWKILRQKLSPTFTSSKMRKMFPLILECGEILQNIIADRIQNTNDMDIRELVMKFTTDTIGSCAFGLNMNSMNDDNSPFRQIGKQISESSKIVNILRLAYEQYPWIFNFFKISPRSDSSQIDNFFVNIVKELIKDRSIPSTRQDFIDIMLELREKGFIAINKNDTIDYFIESKEETLEITDELIAAQCFVFFLAGFETSATTMSYALLELAHTPDVQKKLQREIDAVLKKHDGKITYDAIQEMEYLDMVIKETLRKYPPIAMVNRVCTSTYNIPDTDIFLDKGVRILIPVYALHYDEQYFLEPTKFKPERFASDTGNTHHKFSYLPFGEGPRNCIGLRFGKLQTTTGLISFLRKYSVELCSGTPAEIRFMPAAFFLTSADDIYLKVQPRV